MDHEAPTAPARPHVHREHGVERPDPYAWLKDREDPAVLAHLEAENAFTEAATAHLADLRQALYDELLGRIQEDDTSVPWPRDDGWLYLERTAPGKAYVLHCRQREGGPEQILLDENERAEGHEYYSLGAFQVSPSGRWLAWAEDTNGAEKYTIRFKDLETGAVLPHRIEGAKTSLAWADDDILFYSVPDEIDRPYRLCRHDRTRPDQEDAVVFEEADESFYLGAHRSRDGRQIVLSLQSKVTSEVHLLPTSDPTAPPQRVWPRVAGVEYEVEPAGDRLFVLTNQGEATNFQVLSLPIDDLGAPPEVVLAPDLEVYRTRIDAFAGHLVVWERRQGLPGVEILDLSTDESHRVTFDEAAFTVSPEHNAQYAATTLRFVYQSLVTPASVYAYDLASQERRLLKRDPVPTYDPTHYVTERLWATSHDGVEVPISLVRHRDVTPDGDNPFLLAGYGSYGLTSEASFRRSWVSLLDRGVVCAVAHIRGGGELGRPWYESGKFLQKRNTFHDFIACAEHLIGAGWTRPERLGIWGGSAGGMLMGAVMNERPELFRVVLALVPFVDVLTTMFDESLPLTVTEYEEWGNPNQREYFEYMLSYSPYDNVTAQAYPEVLITAGLNDPRVGYWEPAKWAARLRERAQGEGLVLLKTHLGAGHAGASGRYGRIEEIAFEYAFLLDRLGAVDAPEG